MAFWDIDLTTRMGAESAANQGALGCFLLAGLTVVAAFISSAVVNTSTLEGQIAIGFVVFQATVCLLAGIRLRQGKGAYLAMAVVAFLVIEIIAKLVTLTALLGLVINVVLLVVVFQGVRGALALKNTQHFEEDDIAAFE